MNLVNGADLPGAGRAISAVFLVRFFACKSHLVQLAKLFRRRERGWGGIEEPAEHG